MTDEQHIQTACAQTATLANSDHWVVVGEWSPAKTDCAGVNERTVGSRYAGTYAGGSTPIGNCTGLSGPASTFSSGYKAFLRQFWEAQVQTFEKASNGWIMWTWKMEDADDWSYQAGLANGWIPQNPTNYMYPNICG
jgi:glucan 1,3-beta-glucosidase